MTRRRLKGSRPGLPARRRPSIDLRRLYQFYNRRYFGGRCPRGITIVGFTGRQFSRGELGQFTTGRVTLRSRKGKRVALDGPLILLRVDEPIMVVKHTLLHEMVHSTGIYNHGPRFNRAMLRLAKMGAFNNIW